MEISKGAMLMSKKIIIIDEQAHKWEEIKNFLKEIKGKLNYINTPKNQHNIFDNDFMKRLDNLLKTEKKDD